MIFTRVLRLALFVVLLTLAATPGIAQETTPVPEQRTTYPVTIENCGQEITFTEPPRRVITSSVIQASFLLALEQDTAIIGMYSDFLRDEPERVVAPDVVDRLLAIPVLGEGGLNPSREVPIALGPDFYYADNPTDLETSASREDYATIGANVFMSTYGCTDPSLQTIDMFFEEILTLGVIFDAQPQAEAVVDQLRSDLETTAERVQGVEPVRVAFIESFGGSVWAVGNGIFTDAIARAGGESLFDGFTYDTPPAFEVFAASNPDVILYWDINPETVTDFDLAALFVGSPAIVNDRVVEVRYLGGVNLRIAEFVDALARALHPEAFTDTDPEATAEAAARTVYPVTIETCGRTITVDAPPQRVYTTYWNGFDTLARLGLADRVVALAFVGDWDGGDLAEQYEAIPNQYEQYPVSEEALVLEADFVIASYDTFDFPDVTLSMEDWAELGTPVYSMSSECGGSDATQARYEMFFDDVRTLGVIFDVQAEAEALIAEMQGRLDAIQTALADVETVSAVLYYGGEGPLNVYTNGVYGSILELAGGQTIFPDAERTFGQVSAEVVATLAPEAYLIFPFRDSFENLRAFLYTAFPDAPATLDDRALLMPEEFNVVSYLTVEAIEQVARMLHPEAFEE